VDITELCPSATVLAQQLTHVELERLSYIGPEEFVQAFAKVSTSNLAGKIADRGKIERSVGPLASSVFSTTREAPSRCAAKVSSRRVCIVQESPHLETSFKDMKKTRNLESYVQWFNRLSYFVATEVCKVSKCNRFNSRRSFRSCFFPPDNEKEKSLQRCGKYRSRKRDTRSNCEQNEQLRRSRLTTIGTFSACEEEATRTRGRILDRDCSGVLQHWQLQFPHGDHSWPQHVAHISPEENGE